MKSEIFLGKIIKHPRNEYWKSFSPNSPDWMQNQLNKFNIGDTVALYLEDKKPKRSIAQNSFYWMYLEIISQETGYTKEELHSLFKGKFLSNGITEVFGNKVRKVKSTTKLSKGEFIEYIYNIEIFTGITAPETKYYGLD